MYVYIYTYTVFIFLYIRVCMYACIYAVMYVCMDVCMDGRSWLKCVLLLMHIHMCKCTLLWNRPPKTGFREPHSILARYGRSWVLEAERYRYSQGYLFVVLLCFYVDWLCACCPSQLVFGAALVWMCSLFVQSPHAGVQHVQYVRRFQGSACRYVWSLGVLWHMFRPSATRPIRGCQEHSKKSKYLSKGFVWFIYRTSQAFRVQVKLSGQGFRSLAICGPCLPNFWLQWQNTRMKI